MNWGNNWKHKRKGINFIRSFMSPFFVKFIASFIKTASHARLYVPCSFNRH